MKIEFYFDVYPWTKPESIYPMVQNPSEKPRGAKRYKIEVEISDPAQPDEIITSQAIEV